MCVLAGLLAAARVQARAARPNDPVVSIPLEPLGFTGFPKQFMLSRSTMYTVHFVDASHVLLTYSSKSLMARLPDAGPKDDDRNVAALLLELPSGKVLARTEWRTRDRDQYLWPLRHGRFLLRIRSKLTLLDPMQQMKTGEAFRQMPFLESKRPVGYISVSAAGDLLTVETVPHERAKDAEIGSNDADLDPDAEERDRRVPVQIHFYRLIEQAGQLTAVSSGVVFSPALVNVPATADGYLDVKKESSAVFDFDFKSHAGKLQELAAYDTSCTPRPYFVSRSEFVAFGCRGSSDKVELSGFNLRGEEPWVETFSDTSVGASIVSAPAGGRFALERLVLSQGFSDPDNLTAEQVSTQEVQVLQNHDGRILMKVQPSPFQRVGQNFDLSDDGLGLVTVTGGNLVVYRLPALTGKDKSEVARATEANPPANTAVIQLDSVPVEVKAEAKAEGVKVGTEVMKKSAGEVVQPPVGERGEQAAEPNAPVVGDVPEERRKAPSLYDADHPKPPSN